MFLAKRQVYTFTTDPRDIPKDLGNKISLHAVDTMILGSDHKRIQTWLRAIEHQSKRHWLSLNRDKCEQLCHVQIYSFFSRLHLNIKCTWRGRGEYSEYCTRFWQANSHTTSRQCPGQSPVFVSVSAIEKNMFFVFFGVRNQGPRGQGQTLGVNCGEFA